MFHIDVHELMDHVFKHHNSLWDLTFFLSFFPATAEQTGLDLTFPISRAITTERS